MWCTLGMTHRQSVSMTEQTRRRLEQYATAHGASVGGALVALAVMQLNAIDAATATRSTTPAQRKRRVEL